MCRGIKRAFSAPFVATLNMRPYISSGYATRCSPVHYPVPDRSGDEVLISIDFFVYIFISFFVSLLARLRENGCTDLHEIFREGVEWPWDETDHIFGQFGEILRIDQKWNQVVPLPGETARCRDAQHGDGICCAFAPQLVCTLLVLAQMRFVILLHKWIWWWWW